MGSNPHMMNSNVSFGDHCFNGERTNPGIWRDIEGRFRALRKEHGDSLVANWISGSWNESGDQWYLSGATNDREREVFIWLAERATVELGYPGGHAALFLWLDLLKTESPNFKSGTVISHTNANGMTTEFEAGTIHRLIEASADYCLRLETKGILKARVPKRAAEKKNALQDQIRRNLTENQQRRIKAAESELQQRLAAHEQMREIVDPGEWQPVGSRRGGPTIAGQIRKLERDFQRIAMTIFDVLAEASWQLGSVEQFRTRIEADGQQVLEWILAKVNPKDLPLLDRSAVDAAVHEGASKWITKAQREFPPPWFVDHAIGDGQVDIPRPADHEHGDSTRAQTQEENRRPASAKGKLSENAAAAGRKNRDPNNKEDSMFVLEERVPATDRVVQTDPVWRIRGTQKTPIPVTRLNGEVVWVNTPTADEPDDALLKPEEEMRIGEETLTGRSELRSELETVFAGSAWPLPSAIIDPFRRYAVKVFDVNAAAYRNAVSKQAKDANEVLDAFIGNLLIDVFGIEWEKSPGDKVVRIDWQCGTDGWKGREIALFARNDPDPRCLYHQLIGDAIEYRYRFHAPLPEPIPGEPPCINLSGEEWFKYIGLKERHNLAMAIRPYLEDRKAHWQFVYASPMEDVSGGSKAPETPAKPSDRATEEHLKSAELEPRSEDNREPNSRKKRGRPTEIPEERKRKALAVQGGKARAQILYAARYPTPQQIKNVSSILRHFQRTHQKSE